MLQIVSALRKWFDGLSKQQKLYVGLLMFSLFASLALFALGGTSSIASDPLDSTPFYFFSAFVKLIIVLLLIVGVALVFRRWIQPGAGINATRQMRLVETIRLSPRQALHLVTVGNQKLLIGATDQSVSLISPIEADESGLEFGALLHSIQTGENENTHA